MLSQVRRGGFIRDLAQRFMELPQPPAKILPFRVILQQVGQLFLFLRAQVLVQFAMDEVGKVVPFYHLRAPATCRRSCSRWRAR